MRDFASQLDGVVKGCERPASFTPSAYYNKVGDCVEFIASPDRFYAERIDDLVTVYYSYETREIASAVQSQCNVPVLSFEVPFSANAVSAQVVGRLEAFAEMLEDRRKRKGKDQLQ